jgi:hypothetical protein
VREMDCIVKYLSNSYIDTLKVRKRRLGGLVQNELIASAELFVFWEL